MKEHLWKNGIHNTRGCKMLKNKIRPLGIILAFLLCMMVFTSSNTTASEGFTITSHEVVLNDDYASLLIRYDCHPVPHISFDLYGPDGEFISSKMADYDDGQVYMHLTQWRGVTPTGGTYKLETGGYEVTKFYTYNFNFAGPDLSVTNVETEWSYDDGCYGLKECDVTIENKGDLPVFVNSMTIEIGGRGQLVTTYSSEGNIGTTIMPNQETTIHRNACTIHKDPGIYSIDNITVTTWARYIYGVKQTERYATTLRYKGEVTLKDRDVPAFELMAFIVAVIASLAIKYRNQM